MKYNKEELIKAIEKIPEPLKYDDNYNVINEKTKIIKKIQKEYDLVFSQIYRLYKLDIKKLNEIFK